MIVDDLVEYTINGITQYLEIGGLHPEDVAILVEPRYEDQSLATGEYRLSEDQRWTVGIHVRPLDYLSGADSTYNADITVEFEDIPTDTFTKDVYPAIIDGFEDEFSDAELQYLDPSAL